MTPDVMRDLLAPWFEIVMERPINHGHQFRVDTGAVVNVYTTGTVLVQGDPESKKRMEAWLESQNA